MQWVEGFTEHEGVPHLVCVRPTGERHLRPFRELRSAAPERTGNRVVNLSDCPLSSFRECPPQELLALAGFSPSVSEDHRVYELITPSARLLVPAAAIWLTLFPRIGHYARWLLSAASLDRLAVPTFSKGRAEVTFYPSAIGTGYDPQERFLWMTGFPSARNTWRSVSESAKAGKIEVKLPHAMFTGSARGMSRGDTLLVTQFSMTKVTPTESPMPTATTLAGRSFELIAHGNRFQTAKQLITFDKSLTEGQSGWNLSDKEWDLIAPHLAVRESTRNRINEVFVKMGSGKSWDSISKKTDARAYYLRMRRQGRWETIRDLIAESRKISADVARRVPQD